MMASLVFDHVGWVVRDLAAAQAELRRFGFDRASPVHVDERQGVHILFMTGPGERRPRVELVWPSREDSVVGGLLTRQGAGPYHAAYLSSSLGPDVDALVAAGYRLLAEPMPSPAFQGRLFCFLYGAELGLVELVEATDAGR
jgi:hypothetical protein